jgi:hypothetical protein
MAGGGSNYLKLLALFFVVKGMAVLASRNWEKIRQKHKRLFPSLSKTTNKNLARFFQCCLWYTRIHLEDGLMKRLAVWQRCCCFLVAFLLGVTSPAIASNFIEMDGNAIDNADQDWQTFHNGNDDGSAAFSGIVADPAPLSIFTGGGSKDINDIPDWKYRDGSVPDKNDLTNGYAAGKLIDVT